MATIGRSKAVVERGNLRLTGLVAWLAWLFVHLIKLMGSRNRVMVFIQWVYSYLSYQRGARLIFRSGRDN
jgi:NADH:ubiquinone reductase (H+-translocating)